MYLHVYPTCFYLCSLPLTPAIGCCYKSTIYIMKIRTKMWSRLFATFAALLLGASAVQAQSDPISVLNSEEFYNSTALAVVTNSFEVMSDPNGKLVVTIGSETGASVVSVTYGGVALSEAIDLGFVYDDYRHGARSDYRHLRVGHLYPPG